MYADFRWPAESLPRNALTRIYEPVQPFLLFELAHAFGAQVFVDVGANVGAYSLIMSRLPGLEAILAFEPAPASNRLLREAVTENGLDGLIRVFDLGISDREGMAEFGMISETSGANSIVASSIHAHDTFSRVRTIAVTPLARVLADTGRRLCIKIDVEGHESEALAGARCLLANNRVLLQIESYEEEGGAAGRLLAEMGFAALTRIGPDRYFTNAPDEFDANRLVQAFEAAASRVVQSNLALQPQQGTHSPGMIRRSIGPVTVELGGRLAGLLRRMKATLAPQPPG